MKKNKFIICLMSILMLFTAAMGLTACDEDNSAAVPDQQSYYSSVELGWKKSAEYSGEFAMPAGVTLGSFSAADFSMTGYVPSDNGEDSAEIIVKNFNVEKKSESAFKLSFTNPLNTVTDTKFILQSNKAVTADNSSIAMIIYVTEPDFAFTGDTLGLYEGSSAATIGLEFVDDGVFAKELRTDMFVLPEVLQSAEFGVVRISDTKAELRFSDMSENLPVNTISIKVLAEAIDSSFAKDVLIETQYLHPSLDVHSATFGFVDKTVSIGNLKIGEEYTFVADSVEITDGSDLSISSQAVSANNALSMSVLSAVSDYNSAFAKAEFSVKVKTEDNVVLTVPFTVSLTDAGVYAEITSHDYENRKLEITLSACFGTFAEDVTLADVTVSNAKALQNFSLKSKSDTEIVIACDYPEMEEESIVAAFTVADSKFVTTLQTKDLEAEVTVPIIPSDRFDIDWKGLGTSALTGFASAIGSAAASFALPYIYEFLGVDTSDPQINAIQTKLDSLIYSIDKLSVKIDGILEAMELNSYKRDLKTFASKTTELRTMTNKLIVSQATIDYMKSMVSGGQTGYTAFRLMMGNEFQSKVSTADGISLYNDIIRVARETEADYYNFADYVSSCISDPNKEYVLKVLRASKSIEDDAFSFFIDASTKPCPLPTDATAFINLIENNTTLSKIISAVLDYGNQILGEDLNSGILSTYFGATNLIYNFESQTIELRKAYANKVFSTYLNAATFAIQYAFDSKDSINWAELTMQVREVVKVIEKFDAKFKEMDALNESGKDKILVSSQIVSKTMKTTDNPLSTAHVEVSLETYRDMNNRAGKRGTSIIGDLKAAGFGGYALDKSGAYVFGYKNPRTTTEESAFVKRIGGVFGAKTSMIHRKYCDLVSITSAGAMTEKKDTLIWTGEHWQRWIYTEGKNMTYNFDKISVFAA